MNVSELIELLNKVDDKTLDVGVQTDDVNLWVTSIQVNNTGAPGYTDFGSVELIVSE